MPYDYDELMEEHKLYLLVNKKRIESLLFDSSSNEDYPRLQKWLSQYGRGRKLLHLLDYAIEHYYTPSKHDEKPFFIVSIKYLFVRYKGSIGTWHKLMQMLAAFNLIEIQKPADPLTQKGGRNTTAQNRSIAIMDGKGQKNPSNHYHIPRYTDEVLAEADARIQQFYEDAGNAGGFSKAMMIDLYGQKEANRITDDCRRKTKVQIRIENLLETALTQMIHRRGFAVRDDLLAEIMQMGSMPLSKAEYHLKRCLPLLIGKYNLVQKRLGKQKQTVLGLISDKTFLTLLLPHNKVNESDGG